MLSVATKDMGGIEDYVHRIGRTARGVNAKGKAPRPPNPAAGLVPAGFRGMEFAEIQALAMCHVETLMPAVIQMPSSTPGSDNGV